MKKTKKIIISIILTLILYGLLSVVEKRILESKANINEMYVISQNIPKGEKLTDKYYKKIKILANKKIENKVNVSTPKYAAYDLKKGQILYNEMIIPKEKLLKATNNKEIISIPLKFSYDSVSYKVSKDSIVNIYFTTRAKFLEGINHNKEILSNENQNGFITLSFLKDVKVIDVVDREGFNKKEEEKFLPETILIEVTSDDAKLIKNLKNIGEFSLTMEK